MGRFERLPSNASCGCCGIFKGSLNGFHTFEFADGSTYEGEWVSGHPNGVGKYVWASGTLYSGQFSKGVPSGQGQLLLADGTVYLGAFSGGQIGGGSGEVRFTPGTVGAEAAAFQGEFLSSNTAEGHGVFQFPNKTRVESDWKEGSNVESAERDRERQERERERATKAAKGRRDPPARRSSQHSRDKGMNGVSADSFKINPGQVLIDSSQGSIRLRRKAKLEAEGSERCLELVAAP